MKSTHLLGLYASIALSVAACSSGGGDSTPPPVVNDDPPVEPPVAVKGEIISPPDNTSLPYNTVSVSVTATDIESVTVLNTTIPDDGAYNGVLNGDRFIVHGVGLASGSNDLQVIATETSGAAIDQTLSVVSTNDASPAGLSATRSQGYGVFDTSIQLRSAVPTATSFSFDFDGDGVLDITQDEPEAPTTYSTAGTVSPLGMIETSDGLLYSARADGLIAVRTPPIASEVDALAGITVVDFHVFDNETVFVLSSDQVVRQVRIADDTIEREIALSGLVSPSGLCMDTSENIYVTDTGMDRVYKFLAGSGYRPDELISSDGGFGSAGTDDGQFAGPADCMVDSTPGDEKIFVVDRGNNRIQVFNRAGVFLSAFDGTGTAAGQLNNPNGILGTSDVPVVVDTGNNLVRIFNQDGTERRNFGDSLLAAPTRITASDFGLIIADTGNNRLALTTSFGDLIDELELTESPEVAINTQGGSDVFYVATTGRAGAMKYASMLDPSDSGPDAVVQEFVAAIIADDRRTLSRLAADATAVDGLYADVPLLSELVTLLATANAYDIQAMDNVFAGVTISFEGIDQTLPVTLVRFDDSWYIKRF